MVVSASANLGRYKDRTRNKVQTMSIMSYEKDTTKQQSLKFYIKFQIKAPLF